MNTALKLTAIPLSLVAALVDLPGASSETTSEPTTPRAAASGDSEATTDPLVRYGTETVDGLDIFYREAGSAGSPQVVLLHGFPTSSHMFRDLIPRLAQDFHVIAPDYPGFGLSSMPGIDEFDYTF